MGGGEDPAGILLPLRDLADGVVSGALRCSMFAVLLLAVVELGGRSILVLESIVLSTVIDPLFSFCLNWGFGLGIVMWIGGASPIVLSCGVGRLEGEGLLSGGAEGSGFTSTGGGTGIGVWVWSMVDDSAFNSLSVLVLGGSPPEGTKCLSQFLFISGVITSSVPGLAPTPTISDIQ